MAIGRAYPTAGGLILDTVAQVGISHPLTSPVVEVTGTGDDELRPSDGGYVLIENEYSQIFVSGEALTVESDGRILCHKSGILRACGFTTFTHNSAVVIPTIGWTFGLDRSSVVTLIDRSTSSKLAALSAKENTSTFETIEVQDGDVIGVYVASDITGNISISSSSMCFELYVA